MSVIIIDESTKARIKQVREHARRNRFSTEQLQEIINGTRLPPGDDENFVVNFQGTGMKMVVSLEEQPKGIMWHVSVSIPKANAYASPALLEMVLESAHIPHTKIISLWLEPLGPERTALNVLAYASGIDTL